MEPRVFVLDEPSSNLDADSVLELRAVIAYMKSLGKTVVLSEHRLYYLHGLAGRYVYMRGGRITGDYTAADEILARLDLTALRARHPASLSGGQKQRLAIASAIAAGRAVVFLDEPTSGLDYRHMLQVAQLLRLLRAEGKTVYVITHDPELICECCTDIIHMESGDVAGCYPLDARGLEKIRGFFRIDGAEKA